jgi:ubiquinone/menaquinone biosynthesis C-methylase UbiE
MGHVFDFTEAKSYERWFNSPRNKLAFELETQLMKDLLQPMRGESVLDIGCGTGACLSALHEMGLQVTGLDPSTYMLDLALEKWETALTSTGVLPKTCHLMTIRLITPAFLPHWNL